MILFDEVRREVFAAIKAAHEANYPAMKANYPNLTVVDIEHQEDPFISVELDLSGVRRTALGEREMLVPGRVDVNYYYREGTGSSGAWAYADTLNDILGMVQIGSILFRNVQPIQIQTFPGWKGLQCGLMFDIVPALAC